MKEAMHRWPQAISADEGDLRRLHEWANAGAQKWSESISWPDYFWLGAEEASVQLNANPFEKHLLAIAGPAPAAPACFAFDKQLSNPPPAGPTLVRLSGRIEAIVEIKVVEADIGSKLAKHKPEHLSWPEFLNAKLDQCFRVHLRDADGQVAAGHRLLGLPEARGVAVLVNAGPPNLNREMVSAYLACTIKDCPNLDVIIYLADDYPSTRLILYSVFKRKGDSASEKFVREFETMLRGFNWKKPSPVCLVKGAPDFLMRIEMDKQSCLMVRNWCAGWRVADNPRPIPSISMNISLMPRKEFKSGLPMDPGKVRR